MPGQGDPKEHAAWRSSDAHNWRCFIARCQMHRPQTFTQPVSAAIATRFGKYLEDLGSGFFQYPFSIVVLIAPWPDCL